MSWIRRRGGMHVADAELADLSQDKKATAKKEEEDAAATKKA